MPVASQGDHVRMLQQQQLVGHLPRFARGNQLLLQLQRLAVVDAPEFAQRSNYALMDRP